MAGAPGRHQLLLLLHLTNDLPVLSASRVHTYYYSLQYGSLMSGWTGVG